MAVRPVAEKYFRVEVVGGRCNVHGMTGFFDELPHMLTHIPDEGVGFHIRFCPLPRRQFFCNVASDDRLFERQEKGDHRSGLGEKFAGKKMGRSDNLFEFFKYRVSCRCKADQGFLPAGFRLLEVLIPRYKLLYFGANGVFFS